MDKQLIQIERKFRPEIEGLRVVAALLVATYHIWFNRVSGGVDVFFVVSGFLITTSIISTINRTGTFKFLPYISKLLKRLLPSVFFILAVVLLLSFFLLPQTILDKTIKEIIASMFYFENWQLAFSNTDYLDSQQMKTPVEHFWAMSIQGQFYIIWFMLFAFILWAIKKYQIMNTRKLINFILGSVFIVSLIYSIYLTSVNQPFAYFITFTRVWEFSLGGLLCVNLAYIRINKVVAMMLGWLGLIGLVLTGMLFDVSQMFPGYIALWPMACAVFIIVSGTVTTRFGVRRILASPVMIKLGGLSFGVYLWHWVILSFYHYNISRENPNFLEGMTIIIASFILSYLMTRFIEKPIRESSTTRRAFRRISWIGTVNLILIAVLVSTNLFAQNQQAKNKTVENYPGAVAALGKVEVPDVPAYPTLANVFNDLPQSHIDGSNQTQKEADVKVGVYGKKEGYTATIAVVGSSHSEQWLGGVLKAVEGTDYRVLNITRSATRFSTGYDEDDIKSKWVENTLAYIKEQDIDLVVGHATASNTDKERIQEHLLNPLRELKEAGVQVLALRDNPRYKFNVVESLDQDGEQKTIEKMNREQNQLDGAAWTKLEKSQEFHTLDLTQYFKIGDEFRPIIGNVVVYRDYDHITNTYAESFAPIFEKQFNDILKK